MIILRKNQILSQILSHVKILVDEFASLIQQCRSFQSFVTLLWSPADPRYCKCERGDSGKPLALVSGKVSSSEVQHWARSTTKPWLSCCLSTASGQVNMSVLTVFWSSNMSMFSNNDVNLISTTGLFRFSRYCVSEEGWSFSCLWRI